MRLVTIRSESGKVIFHFNGDFSGDITIEKETSEGGSITIPANVLLQFVAYYYTQPEKIRKIEDMSIEELLGR